jgi:nuclear pore complex protein Nup155
MTEESIRTDATTQGLIASMTFEELITGQNGVAASRALVNVIIDQQIGQQIAVSDVVPLGLYDFNLWSYQVDTISDILQTRCGSFCSTDDVMLYKVRIFFSIFFDGCRTCFVQAKESVRRAVESRNPQERQGYLGESLR